jgi:CRAL/TRIO domain
LYSYLRIMKWPSNLFARFPFKLCKKGCDAKVAIQHTLEFREKFKPWLVTRRVIQGNEAVASYHRGYSPDYAEGESGGHAIVWLRPARRNPAVAMDDGLHVRSVVQTLDRAVAASMRRSGGRVGKFNIVVDGTDFSWGMAPSLPSMKALVTILQDHYVNRLGVVVLVNAGRLIEILLRLIHPLITEEVRNKIMILPSNEEKRKAALAAILGEENIPTWLGGTDDFEFDADEYYDTARIALGTESEATEYRTTMPYHSWDYVGAPIR